MNSIMLIILARYSDKQSFAEKAFCIYLFSNTEKYLMGNVVYRFLDDSATIFPLKSKTMYTEVLSMFSEGSNIRYIIGYLCSS